MRLLAPYTQGEWADLAPSEDEESGSEDYEPMLRRSLTDFFRSENLVVLTGLGTSLWTFPRLVGARKRAYHSL
ncbi:hypothetical protein [Planctomicrobium sp. SH527]|uniref:hypothetical protein n=1 Tax=Planctomicrobium sp. SH527 TaxID=3448123 RepID=UPI003F5C7946